MMDKFITDLKSPKKQYTIAQDLHNPRLENYYFVFEENRVASGQDQKLISRFDENGIPINKTYIDVSEKEYVYYPISIGQLGLAVFHTYLSTKLANDKSRFFKFVDWYYNNASIDDKLGALWLTDVPLPQYQNPGPWQSAFAQSRAISILLRGYLLSGDEKYSEMAELSLIPYTKSVKQGGVTSFIEYGPFYEEYTAKVPTLVLNGMIFSLFGIMDFLRVFPKHKLAKHIYDEGISTLLKILPEFNLGFWSRYNLCQAEWYPAIDPATIGYQRLHVIQLDVMFRYTKNDSFKKYRDIFEEQDTLSNIVKMYKTKYRSLKSLNRL